MFKKLQSFAPQRIFLIQGNIDSFNTLVEDTKVQIPQVESESLSRFTVEDAQKIIDFNLERQTGSWCIVYFDIFVTDAAQALLKTLEEPRDGIHIVFVTPRPYLIPQTILSRVRLIPNVISNTTPSHVSSKASLLEYIKETFGKESEEDASVRRAQATILLDDLEHYFKDDKEKIKVLYEAKEMLFKANMPTKQVVEYLVSMVY